MVGIGSLDVYNILLMVDFSEFFALFGSNLVDLSRGSSKTHGYVVRDL